MNDLQELFLQARKELKEEKEKIKQAIKKEYFSELIEEEEKQEKQENPIKEIKEENIKSNIILLDNFSNELTIYNNELYLYNKKLNIPITNLIHETNINYIEIIKNVTLANGEKFVLLFQNKKIDLIYYNKENYNLKNQNINLEKPSQGKIIKNHLLNKEYISLTSEYTMQELKKDFEEITGEKIPLNFAYSLACYLLTGKCFKNYLIKARQFKEKYFNNILVLEEIGRI